MQADDRVLQLGALNPLLDLAEARAACHAMGARAATLLRANRTVGLAARRLGTDVDADSAFAQEFAAHRERLAQRVSMIVHSVELVADLGRRAGVPVYGMKGLVMRELYPDPVERDVRDVDVWVADVDAAGLLARELLQAGFVHDANELPWVKRADGTTYGQVRLSAADPELAPVDVHFGPYSVGHRGRLPLTASPARHVSPLPLLAEDVNLRATLGNATGDCLVTTKDLNDYSLVVPAMADWAWEEHVTLAARVGALRMLRTILHRLVATQEVDPVVVHRDRLLARRGVLPLRLERLPARSQRTRATVRRAVVQARRAREGSGLSTGLSAWRYYRKPLRLQVVPPGEPQPETPTLASAASDRCLRLVPVELVSDQSPPGASDGPAGLGAVPTPSGELVRLAGTLYVPTVDYRLDPALVAELVGRTLAGRADAQVGPPA